MDAGVYNTQNRKLRVLLIISVSMVFLTIVYNIVLAVSGRSTRSPSMRRALKGGQLAADSVLWFQFLERTFSWRPLTQPCAGRTEWSANKTLKLERRSSDEFSYLIDDDFYFIEGYSCVVLQTVFDNGSLKHDGGDSWQSYLYGETTGFSSVQDNMDGTYTLCFFAPNQGTYMLDVFIDYSDCDSMKDPPAAWFIKGNYHGKYQQHRDFPEKPHPYIHKRLWGHTIRLQVQSKSLRSRPSSPLSIAHPNESCVLIGGPGYWRNLTWSYVRKGGCNDSSYVNCPCSEIDCTSSSRRPAQYGNDRGVLWVYGDSVTVQIAKILLDRDLCTRVFRECRYTYLWSYSLRNESNLAGERQRPGGRDFDHTVIIDELRGVMRRMDHSSTLLLGLGVHYVQSLPFHKYQQLVYSIIQLLKRERKNPEGYHGEVIWRTSSAIFMEKYGAPGSRARYAMHLRFLTLSRLELFNAFASDAFCRAGVPVLETYHVTRTYPLGSGFVYNPWDAMHFRASAYAPIVEALEEYLLQAAEPTTSQ